MLTGGVTIILIPIFHTYVGFTVTSLIRGVASAVFLSQRSTIAADCVDVGVYDDAIGLMIGAMSGGMTSGNLLGGNLTICE